MKPGLVRNGRSRGFPLLILISLYFINKYTGGGDGSFFYTLIL